MSISHLIAALQESQLLSPQYFGGRDYSASDIHDNLTPREIAEIIWLWVQTTREEEPSIPETIPKTPQVTTPDSQSSTIKQRTSLSTVIETSSDVVEIKLQSYTEDLYPKVVEQYLNEQDTHQEQKYPLQVPDAPAISNQRQLERSLKSLRRNFKSFGEKELDENQTINTIVEQTLSNPNSPIWIPIFKPTLTRRWLHLVLVIEVNNSLVIWKQTITELKLFLRRLGIFKSLETWGMKNIFTNNPDLLECIYKLILYISSRISPQNYTDSQNYDLLIIFLIIAHQLTVAHQKEGIQLFHYEDPQMRPYPPEAINSQGKNTLILLVSDLVSPAWYRSEIYTLLRQWSRKGMVNLLQLLPERLWSRTVLGQQNRLILQSTTKITHNQKLISLFSAKTAKLNEFKLPVTSLEPHRLEEWSKLLMGIGDNQCIGYGISHPQISPPVSSQKSHSEISAQERVQRFQSIASPTALKLAELLSAVIVTLPVIRVITYTILPTNANQSYVAEVLMGGLFQPLTETITPNINPDEIEFQFFPGVREELLSWLTVPEIISTIEKVSAYLAEKMGISLKEFEALLISSKNLDSDLAKQIYPFAKIEARVLQKLGGAYATFAEKIQSFANTESPPFQLQKFKVSTITLIDDSINPQTFNFEVATIEINKEINNIDISNNNNLLLLVNEAVFKETGRYLNELEEIVLVQGGLERLTYQQVAELINDTESNLRQNIAPKLWKLLTVVIGKKVTDTKINKSNAKGIIIKWANLSRLTIHRQPQQTTGFIEILDNDIQLEMMLIPAGSFIMGSPENELERSSSESPQHQVNIKAFFLGKYPVTQAQWRFVAALPQVNQELDPDPSTFKGANRPVENVSWDDAVEFCSRLSRYTGKPYRLPSEAEWEYACRAGTTTPFHFGETITTYLANYDGTDNEEYKWSGSYGQGPKGIYREETTEVGSFGVANNFGLYDMHGNVWEWCQDHWHSSYEGAPIDGSAWLDNNDNNSRMLRGGSWGYNPGNCRSACRYSLDAGLSFHFIGFRVACAAAWNQ